MWRPEITQLEKWAKKRKLRTGKYMLCEFSDRRPENRRRWEACIEIRGRATSDGKVKIKKIPAQTVARVMFDPDKVSPRLVYHGLNDWIKWRIKDGTFKSSGPTREVYRGNPWTNPRAWANTEVQFLVKKRAR